MATAINDVMLCINDVLPLAKTMLRQVANEVVLRTNDVGFRPTMLRLCRKRLPLRRFYAIIFIKVVAELKNDNEIDYAEIALEYFKSKKSA